jgi:hypothetical protein
MQYSMLALVLVSTLCCACSSEPAAPAATPSAAAEKPAVAETPAPAPAPAPEPAAPTEARAPVGEPVSDDVPEAIEGANTSIEEATVDGFTAKQVQCKAQGGVFAGMALLGSLSKQQHTFAGCSDKGETVRAHFAYDGKKVDDVRVAGASTPAAARCVADAISSAEFASPCTCLVSFAIGPAEAAAKAE